MNTILVEVVIVADQRTWILGHLNWGPTYWQKKESKRQSRPRARLEAEKATHQLHTHRPQLVPHLDTLIEALPSDIRTQESTRERIPRAVRIHDRLTRDRRHPKHPSRPRVRPVDENGRFGSLRDHDDARTLGVSLVVRRDALGDLRNIGRVGFEDGFGVFLGFGFVPDDDVGVGEDLLELGIEELEDEGSGEVKEKSLCMCVRACRRKGGGEPVTRRREQGACERWNDKRSDEMEDHPYLVVLRRVFAQLEHRTDAMREEEPFDVKHLGSLHERGNRRR